MLIFLAFNDLNANLKKVELNEYLKYEIIVILKTVLNISKIRKSIQQNRVFWYSCQNTKRIHRLDNDKPNLI